MPTVNLESANLERYELTVAVDATIGDVKRLLSEQTKTDATTIRFWYADGTIVGKDHSTDEVKLSDAGYYDQPDAIRYQFFLPSEKEGHGEVHRTSANLVTEPNAPSLHHNFMASVAKFPKNRMLGSRSYEADGTRGAYDWITYEECAQRVKHVASGFVHLGLKKGARVGIMSANRPEWQLADLACQSQGIVSVPLYDTLGREAIEHIMNHAEVEALVVSKEKLPVVEEVKAACQHLNFIFLMDDPAQDKEFAKEAGADAVFTHTLSAIESLGSEHPSPENPPETDGVATILYTSGTTGTPKGVMSTHRMVLVAADAFYERAEKHEQTDGEQCLFSFLPLTHTYGRTIEALFMGHGNSIGYFQGDTRKLLDDVHTLRPTFFPGVPRVWQKVYDKIRAQVSKKIGVVQYLFSKGLASQTYYLDKGLGRSSFWDRLVFKKTANAFGGRLKLISSGAAPIGKNVPNFLKATLNTRYGEGYGMTETNSSGTATSFYERNYGHIGSPSRCTEVKLVSVPEMDYLVTDEPQPRGEIWIRGASVFSGYLKDPEKTAEALEDGWFKTGDVGMWRADGNLQIIDRKKNIFKLSQGEYIRPEHIENVLKMDRHVVNAFVYGDSLRNYVVGVIVPDAHELMAWCKKNGVAVENFEDACASPAVKEFMAKQLRDTGNAEGLQGFEHCKNIVLHPHDFTEESGLVTPSLKLKRHEAKKLFIKQIDAMYEEAGAHGKGKAASTTSNN